MLAVSLLVALVFRTAARLLLGLFGPDEAIGSNAAGYLRLIALGFPFQAVMLCVTGFLQGQGNVKTLALVMNTVNILVSGTLIFGLLGAPALGLRGAAIGLVCAQGTAAGCGLFILLRRGGMLHDMLRERFRLQQDILGDVLRIGIPSRLETIFWQAASIVLSRGILSSGDVAFAANQLGLQAESLSEMPVLGFGVAATTFTGQALGACDRRLGREYIRQIQRGAIAVIVFGSCILFPRQAMRLLTNDPEVTALGAIYLRLMGLVQIPQNLQRVYTGALKGAGFSRLPMLIGGIRIPFALCLTTFFHTSIVGIWAVVCADQSVRFLLSYLFYRKKKLWEDLRGRKASQALHSAYPWECQTIPGWLGRKGTADGPDMLC